MRKVLVTFNTIGDFTSMLSGDSWEDDAQNMLRLFQEVSRSGGAIDIQLDHYHKRTFLSVVPNGVIAWDYDRSGSSTREYLSLYFLEGEELPFGPMKLENAQALFLRIRTQCSENGVTNSRQISSA